MTTIYGSLIGSLVPHNFSLSQLSLPRGHDDVEKQSSVDLDLSGEPKDDHDDVEKQSSIDVDLSDEPQGGRDVRIVEAGGSVEPKVDTPKPPNPMMDPSSFPDGGRQAWSTVLGAFCALFVSFGWINCIGVFQAYYETHQLSHYSPSTIAWIPALEACFMFLGGSWVGRLYDNYGPRYILLIGSFLHVFGLMMASISTQYYQFLLAQGICSAIGASMIFYPAFSSVATWFFKKRGAAFGIAASGSSLGGVIFPIMVQRLVAEVGFPWTMRICAFMILALLIIANLLIRSRIPPFPKPVKIMDFVQPATELRFGILILASFLYFFGFVFGRTIPAALADKLGRFNVLLLAMVVTTVLVLGMWIPASSNAAIITFAALFGFSSGSIVSVLPACVAGLSDIRQIGIRTGTLFTFVAVAVLVGSPIGGQLIGKDEGRFLYLQIFAGAIMAAGCIPFVILRMMIAEWKIFVKV